MPSYGVEELDANEMKNLDGGVIIQSINNTFLAICLAAMDIFGTVIGMVGDAAGI